MVSLRLDPLTATAAVSDGWSPAPNITAVVSGPTSGAGDQIITLTITTIDKDTVTINGVQSQVGNTDRGIDYEPDAGQSPGATAPGYTFPGDPANSDGTSGTVTWQHPIKLIHLDPGVQVVKVAKYRVWDTTPYWDRLDDDHYCTQTITITGPPSGNGGGGS